MSRNPIATLGKASGLDGRHQDADCGAALGARIDQEGGSGVGILPALVFTLPLPPNQNREQGHWHARHRRKMTYFSQLDFLAGAGLIPAPPVQPFERVTVSAVMRMWAPMDPDNAKYRASKWPMDYLKTRGYIVKDTAKVVTWVGDPEQVIDRSREDARFTGGTLILTLTPREAAR